MAANAFANASHPILAALSNNNILDPSAGIPPNPWSVTGGAAANSVWDCNALTQGTLDNAVGHASIGWCYNPNNGQIWANTALNGGTTTENMY
jgi:hypothetical protein